MTGECSTCKDGGYADAWQRGCISAPTYSAPVVILDTVQEPTVNAY